MLLNISPRNRTIGFVMLSLFVLLFLAVAFLTCPQSVGFNNEPSTTLETGWQIVDADGRPGTTTTLPANLHLPKGQRVAITCELPQELPTPVVLCFRSSQQRVRVFLDGEQVYSFGWENPTLGISKSPGSIWNMVRLPEDCRSRRLTIESTCPYDKYSGYFSEVRIGSKAAHIFYLMQIYVPPAIFSALILLFGLCMILVHIFISHRQGVSKELLYLGCFSVCISMWMLGESRLVQFFFGNGYFATCFSFVAMLTAPIALFKFIGSLKGFKYRLFTDVLSVLFYFQLYVSVLLQITGTLDFIEFMPMLHVMLLIACVSVVGVLLLDRFRNHNGNVTVTLLSIAVLCAFSVVEIMSVYFLHTGAGSFMQLGILMFIFIQLRQALKMVSRVMKLSRLASVDALTGCQNRTAYIQRLMELDIKRNAGVAMIDLDSLKQINDNYGHDAGDDALVRCAKCFVAAFSGDGDCYRIGGDEFIFLGEGTTSERLSKMSADFDQLCFNESALVSYPFSAACGYTVCCKKRDQNLTDTVRRADRLMYRNKRKNRLQRETILPGTQ